MLLAAGELGTDEPDDDDDAAPAPPEPGASHAPGAGALAGLDRLAALAQQRQLESRPPDDLRRAFALWPEHLPILQLWTRVQTQWRQGFQGPTGFDWASLRAHPACASAPPEHREDWLAGLAVMEQAWLAERARLAEQQRKQQGQPGHGALSDG